MKKFEFKLNESLRKMAAMPIRDKYDLLKLLVATIKTITIEHFSTKFIKSESKFILYVDKMSRVVFCDKDKIFAFGFPFHIDDTQGEYLVIKFRSLVIDSMVSSLLTAILDQKDELKEQFAELGSFILDEAGQLGFDNFDIMSFVELVTELCLFEPGYIRYDHDKERADKCKHPEHHLDVFYSSNNTFKLGLYTEIGDQWFLDMLNIRMNCKYIAQDSC